MDRKSFETVIKKIIKDDPLAADLQWSFFVAAFRSYRTDSVLRPYPPMFVTGQQKDVKLLKGVIDEIPPFLRICSQIHTLSDAAILLLKWVLQAKPFHLKTRNKSMFSIIQSLTGHVTEVPSPNFIFEVMPSEQSDSKFEQIRQDRKLIYAYHGSRIENFHSILHNGLASHMNKVSLYGEGTYLSTELAVSMTYSPTGLAWEGSELGHKLGCVAVCEVIDDPSVKCQLKHETPDGGSHSRSVAKGSMGGEVPERYYVVQNNEVLRIKYLLMYSELPRAPRVARSGWIVSWLHRNKFAVAMVFYCLLLLVVGLSNSPNARYALRRLLTLK